MLAAIDLSNPVTVSLILTGIVAAAAYGALILVPAWGSYGRLWERVAASFLTLFILAAMIGLGTALGGAIVWFYDQYS
jgi:O-antigen ligase